MVSLRRERLSVEQLNSLSREELTTLYIEHEGASLNVQHESAQVIMSLEEQLKALQQQQLESSKRESVVMARLTSKEHELAEVTNQMSEARQAAVPTVDQLRQYVLDPSVCFVVESLKKQLDITKEKLEQTQNELNAWKFTRDSHTGKQLMAKCRQLLQENEHLGKEISAGRVARLEGAVALEKALISELRSTEHESEDLILEMDEDCDLLQATLWTLQGQLRTALTELAHVKGTSLRDEYSRIEQLAASKAVLAPTAEEQANPNNDSASATPHSKSVIYNNASIPMEADDSLAQLTMTMPLTNGAVYPSPAQKANVTHADAELAVTDQPMVNGNASPAADDLSEVLATKRRTSKRAKSSKSGPKRTTAIESDVAA